MQRIEININEKELCLRFVIYKDYTEMHGQQNIKFHMCQESVSKSTKCRARALDFPNRFSAVRKEDASITTSSISKSNLKD
jgi:hypothetical protein